jgi:protein gp37
MLAYRINFCQGNPGSITGINIFFLKQWGGAHNEKNGRLLEGKTYDGMSNQFSMNN